MSVEMVVFFVVRLGVSSLSLEMVVFFVVRMGASS